MGCHKTSEPSQFSRTTRRPLHTEAGISNIQNINTLVIQSLGASPIRHLRRDDHIQQPVSPTRRRFLLLHWAEFDHSVQRLAHIFYPRTEDKSCSCGMLCCHPCWLLSWG